MGDRNYLCVVLNRGLRTLISRMGSASILVRIFMSRRELTIGSSYDKPLLRAPGSGVTRFEQPALPRQSRFLPD